MSEAESPISADRPLTAQAFWLTGPHQGELRTEYLDEPGPDELLLHGGWSGVSRGTEGLVWGGGVPEELRGRMRVPLQRGDFPWPIKYGYCRVGRIDGTRKWGFVLGPHQSALVVPEAMVRVLPAGVPPERAVLAANMETALNAVWDAQPGPGDEVAVVGAGVVGALVGWLISRIPGTRVTLVDPADRTVLADAFGVRVVSPADAPREQDLVVHASGTAAGLSTALACAGEESLVLELSWYGTAPVAAPLGSAFHPRRLTLKSSQVGQLPPHRRPRWDYDRRMQVVLELLRHDELDALIDSESPFRALPGILSDLPGQFTHRLIY